MKVIACYKIVPFEESITAAPDRTLALDKAELVIGQYDLNAVEAGAQLVEAVGGELTALTVGGPEVDNSKLRKSILSRGPATAVMVNEPAVAGADSSTTAALLAEAVKKIGEYDLILCGEGSSDLYNQQVGVQLGEILGVPAINGVTGIEPGEGTLKITRAADGETELLSVRLPAVLAVASSINRTRVPSMRDILAAGKKPFTALSGAELGAEAPKRTETLSVLAPEKVDRKCRIFTGDTEEVLASFAAAVKEELK